MLKNASTYEIMTPASVGVTGGTSLVLGKHSGRAAFAARVKELGYTMDGPALDVLTQKLKVLADEKKVVTDADIESLVGAEVAAPGAAWRLLKAHVFTGTEAKPTATVTLQRQGGGSEEETTSFSAMGTGPVDAVYNAIKLAVGRGNDLIGFSVKSVTDGTTALGEVTIKIQPSSDGMGKRSVKGLVNIAPEAGAVQDVSLGEEEEEEQEAAVTGKKMRLPTYSGVAVDKDIIVASAHAYVAGECEEGREARTAISLFPLHTHTHTHFHICSTPPLPLPFSPSSH
jgi:hypothetical protein